MTQIRDGLFVLSVILTVFLFAPLVGQQPTTVPAVPIVTVPGQVPLPPTEGPTRPAVPVKEVPSPAAPAHATESLMWALGASYLFQYIKNSKRLTFITPQTAGHIQALWGFALAVLTAAGVHFSITGSLMDGSGAAITITGVSFNAFKDIAWQWISQQASYDLIVSKQGANAIPAPAGVNLKGVLP